MIKYYPDLGPDQITTLHILTWREMALKTIKPVTWNNYIRHLRSLYNFSIKNELLNVKANPFIDVSIKEGKHPKKIFTETQLNQIEYAISEANSHKFLKPLWFTNTLIKTFRYTGIRRSQLLQLTISDISLERKIIKISAQINKNHRYHEIPISKKLYPNIEKLIFEHKKRAHISKTQLFNINLFSENTRNKNKQMTDDQLSHLFNIISNIVKFKVSPHRFRHTIATQLMRNPQNIYVTQKLLGHSDIKITLSYIEDDPESLRETIDNI